MQKVFSYESGADNYSQRCFGAGFGIRTIMLVVIVYN
jgi:hypothetical protein